MRISDWGSDVCSSDLHELGFTLFERRKGGLHLSEEALSLFAEVEQSFRGLERIAQTARQIREVKAGQLRIGGMPALTLSFLPMVIESFLRDRQIGRAHV